MPNVLPMRRNLEIFHVGFQHIDLNSREAEHRAVVVSRRGFRHWTGSPLSYGAVLASISKVGADRYRLTSDESLIEAQAAGLTLLFPLQVEVQREWGQHA